MKQFSTRFYFKYHQINKWTFFCHNFKFWHLHKKNNINYGHNINTSIFVIVKPIKGCKCLINLEAHQTNIYEIYKYLFWYTIDVFNGLYYIIEILYIFYILYYWNFETLYFLILN